MENVYIDKLKEVPAITELDFSLDKDIYFVMQYINIMNFWRNHDKNFKERVPGEDELDKVLDMEIIFELI